MMISNDTIQEQFLSYLFVIVDMYETFIDLMLNGSQFQHATHYHAEYYMIDIHAKVPLETLLT